MIYIVYKDKRGKIFKYINKYSISGCILALIFLITAIVFVCFSASFKENNRIKQEIKGEKQFTEYVSSKNIMLNKVYIEEVSIPKNFPSIYEQYSNQLKKDGFNLALYKGKKAVLYIGEIVNKKGIKENMEIHILTVDNCSIAENIVNLKTGEFLSLK